MNPILYSPNTIDFSNNGIGTLTDCISCIVTEGRNGVFELQMQYPVTGIHYASIKYSSVLKAVPARNKDADLFRIYRITRPLRGIVTIYAQHISYQMSHIPVSPFGANGLSNAFSSLKSNAIGDCPFEFETDKATPGDFQITVPSSMRSCLGGVKGSILDTYGGEYEFVGNKVILWNSRGANRGIKIRYGKNLTDITQEENIQNTITGIYPYWCDMDGNLVELPEKTISCENEKYFPYPRIIPKDFSSYFETQPSVEELRNVSQNYIKNNNIGVPKVSIKASFVDLAQTEDYKGISMSENVQLCDIVTVEFETLKVSTSAKIIKTQYDVLKEKYIFIEIGEATSNLSNTIREQEEMIMNGLEKESSARDKAFKKFSELMSDASGFFVTKEEQTDGSIIYYMHNKPNIGDSNYIWKLTAEAIGISTDGGLTYPYGLDISGTALLNKIYAIGINADFINTGAFTVNDADGNVIFSANKDTGQVIISALTAFENKLGQYLRINPDDESISLGSSTNPIILKVINNRIAFTQSGEEIAWFSDNQLHTKQLIVTELANLCGLIVTMDEDKDIFIS